MSSGRPPPSCQATSLAGRASSVHVRERCTRTHARTRRKVGGTHLPCRTECVRDSKTTTRFTGCACPVSYSSRAPRQLYIFVATFASKCLQKNRDHSALLSSNISLYQQHHIRISHCYSATISVASEHCARGRHSSTDLHSAMLHSSRAGTLALFDCMRHSPTK